MPVTVRIERSLFSNAFVARVLDGYRAGELIGYGREAGFPEHIPQLFSTVELAKSWLLETGFVIETECLQKIQRYSRLRHCVHCNKILPGKKIKFCSDRCSYFFKQVKNDKPRKFSVAQHLRMARAGRAQRKGRIGCRFN